MAIYPHNHTIRVSAAVNILPVPGSATEAAAAAAATASAATKTAASLHESEYVEYRQLA